MKRLLLLAAMFTASVSASFALSSQAGMKNGVDAITAATNDTGGGSGNGSGKFTKKVVVEEFTSEKCGNCPSAVQMFEGVMAEASMKDKIIPICHHSGYQEDWLCSQAARDYVWFYGGSSGNVAPAFMIDRANSKANVIIIVSF